MYTETIQISTPFLFWSRAVESSISKTQMTLEKWADRLVPLDKRRALMIWAAGEDGPKLPSAPSGDRKHYSAAGLGNLTRSQNKREWAKGTSSNKGSTLPHLNSPNPILGIFSGFKNVDSSQRKKKMSQIQWEERWNINQAISDQVE